MAENRFQKEYKNLLEKKDFQVWTVGGDPTHWKGIIHGPPDSVYEGGVFQLDIKIPEKYPYTPPKIQFDTKVWHPNMSSQTGAICLDILKDEWSPALSIRTALLSIQALLTDPQPDSPQDHVVASQYKDNRALFNETARNWTKTYAVPDKSRDEKVQKIVAMGFSKGQAEQALAAAGWDVEAAVQSLL